MKHHPNTAGQDGESDPAPLYTAEPPCERCGSPIEKDRLERRPGTVLCRNCQSMEATQDIPAESRRVF